MMRIQAKHWLALSIAIILIHYALPGQIKMKITPVGYSYTHADSISGFHYSVGGKIADYKVLGEDNAILIGVYDSATHKKSKVPFESLLHVYNLNLNSQLLSWDRKIPASKDYTLFTGRSVAYYSAYYGQWNFMQFETGKPKVKLSIDFYHIDSQKEIGLTYKTVSPNKTFEALSLRDGSSLWKREIQKDFVTNVIPLADTAVLVVSAGLHVVKLEDGSGWSYYMELGERDYKGFVLLNTLGLITGALTGTYYFTDEYKINLPEDYDMVLSQKKVITINPDTVMCISMESGKLLWEKLNNDKLTNHADFQIYNDSILVTLTADSTRLDSSISPSQNPIVRIYNLENGDKVKQYNLDFAEMDSLRWLDSKMFFLNNKTLISYDYLNDETNTLDDPRDITDIWFDNPYYFNDGKYGCVSEDQVQLLARTSTGEILGIGQSLNILKEFSANELFKVQEVKGTDYLLLMTETNSSILSKDGSPIVKVPYPKVEYLNNSRFIGISDNTLGLFDLSSTD